MIKILAILLTLVSISAFAAPPPECEGATCIELTWDIPTEREDGTAIDTIDRYDLHTTFNNVLQASVEMAGDSVDLYMVQPAPGDYEFKIRTIESGQAGNYSPVVSVVILSPPLAPNISVSAIYTIRLNN